MCLKPISNVLACTWFPLQINYEKESFLDKVTISAEEVYSRLGEEVPRTSTPTPAVVEEVLDRVVADGYDQAVIVTISSGLSSTYDLLRSVATGMPHLRSVLVDSKNIGMGAGLVVLAVARMVEAGATLSDIEARGARHRREHEGVLLRRHARLPRARRPHREGHACGGQPA